MYYFLAICAGQESDRSPRGLQAGNKTGSAAPWAEASR